MQREKFTLKAKATFAIYLLSRSLPKYPRAVAYAKQKTQCSAQALKLYLIKTRVTSIYSLTAASPFTDIYILSLSSCHRIPNSPTPILHFLAV
jgi:hypothetical protein